MRNGTMCLFAVAAALLLVAATAAAGHPGTDVYIASVGHGSGLGGTQWRTTLWIHNPGSSPADCQIQLLLRDQPNPSPPAYNVTVQPGDTVRYDDATWVLFGIEGYGALRVVASEAVVINSRIYNQPGTSISDTQGQFFSAVPASFAIGAGESTDVLGVNQAPDNDFRYNYGLVETTGNTVTTRVTLYDGNGIDLGQRAYTLGGHEARQVGLADLGLGSTPTDNGRLHVEVTGGSGRVIAFGSGIANTSDDPSTFEMTFDAAGSNGGDITAVTAGEGLEGGGTEGDVTLSIADGGVTQQKLSPSGGASGQVLGTDGSALTWQDAGLTLPYNGSFANDSSILSINQVGTGLGGVFQIENPSPGFLASALMGISIGPAIGIWGSSTEGPGVLASSETLMALNAQQGSGTSYVATHDVFETPAVLAESSDSYGVVACGEQAYAGGVAAFALGDSGRAVYALAEGDDSAALYAVAGPGTTDTKAGYFQGDVDITETATVGELGVTGNGGATTPVAYGAIDADGSVLAGTSNIISTWDSGNGRYLISIDGQSYHFTDYVTVVTVATNHPYFARTGSAGGELLVQIYNLSGNAVQADFHFVVFKP